jgi:hypothetical protein
MAEAISPEQERNNHALVTAVFDADVAAESLRQMLREGANPDARYVDGDGFGSRMDCSPLHLAARNDRPDIIELLLSFGANPQALDEDGHTPLHTAAWRGSSACMRALVEGGADVNHCTPYKNSVAHSAMGSAQLKTLPFALQLGLNAMHKNQKNKTPMDYARSHGHIKLAEQHVKQAKPWPRVKLPKGGEVIEKAALFKADKDGQLPLQHPETWHKALPLLDAPLTREELMQADAKGRPWLVRALECRQFKVVSDMLAEQGTPLTVQDWVTPRGEATDALKAVAEKQQMDMFFRSPSVQQMKTQDWQRIYQALPQSARAQVSGFHQMLVRRNQQEQTLETGRGR